MEGWEWSWEMEKRRRGGGVGRDGGGRRTVDVVGEIVGVESVM